MPEIKIFGSSCRLEKGENLLNGLLKKGIRVPYSCRSGVCHACLLKVEQGTPPKGSQDNLTHQQVQQQYILACQSQISDHLHVSLIQRDQIPATIIAIEQITATCLALTLSPRFPVQLNNTHSFITLDVAPDITGECSIHHTDNESGTITIQVDRKVGDPFSSWIHESTTIGDQTMLRFLQLTQNTPDPK